MKKFIVFGLGISGNATVKFLLENNFQVIVGDDNRNSIENLKQALADKKIYQKNLVILNDFSQIIWQEISYLISSPGIPLNYPKIHPIIDLARNHNCPIICDIELLYLFNLKANFIAITGTNGKSTTSALINHIFQKGDKKSALGGNIGKASLSLPRFSDKTENYILEISSFQLDLINHSRFNFACLLNITPDHLDRHQNMENYINSKKRIFLNQKKGDFALINIDNENSHRVYRNLEDNENFKANLVPISLTKITKNGLSIIDNTIYINIDNKYEKILLTDVGNLKGNHNKENIAFAIAVAILNKISIEKILSAIQSFSGLEHRMQIIRKVNNITFINDSKATNASSTKHSLDTFNNIYWIVGGIAKEGGINDLEKYFTKVKYALLIGKSSNDFAKTLEGKVKYFYCNDLENAFAKAIELSGKTDPEEEKNILLSPACASFDQWKNFEERGNFFCNLVNKIN